MKKIIALLLCSLFINTCVPISALAVEDYASAAVEHLSLPRKIEKKTPTNIVNVSEEEITIMPYNVIPLTYAQAFNSKKVSAGDNLELILNAPLKTKESTEVLPAGTKFIAEISKVETPKSFNRSGKVYVTFKNIELPNGQQKSLNAKVFNKKEFLSRGKLNALGKGLGSTLGGMAVGTGAGCGIGVVAGSVVVGGLAVGMPIGFVVGATAGLVTPGLYYKAKAGDKLNIQLLEEMVIKK